MIEQKYCSKKNKDIYGWSALYDVNRSTYLLAGTILLCKKGDKVYMFELSKDVELLGNSIHAEVLPGSMIDITLSYEDSWYPKEPLANIAITYCRFPTKDEFEIYERVASV